MVRSVYPRCCLPILFVAFAASGLYSLPLQAGDWPPVEIDGATLKIEQELSESTTLEFIETPLADVMHFLMDLHGIEIQLEERALDDVGIGSDTPVTRNLKGISLRSALNLMLEDLALTYVIRDEVLLITTPEQAKRVECVQVYDVQPLLDEEYGIDELIDILNQAVDNEPSIKKFRGLLIVRANLRQHQQLRKLLGVIGEALNVKASRPIVQRPAPMEAASVEESGE